MVDFTWSSVARSIDVSRYTCFYTTGIAHSDYTAVSSCHYYLCSLRLAPNTPSVCLSRLFPNLNAARIWHHVTTRPADVSSFLSRNIHLFSPLGKLAKRAIFCQCFYHYLLQYHGLAMRINSAYDACIWCENFVKFGPVTPELTGLICECVVWHGQKNGLIWSNISGSTGPIFAIFTPYESALRADDRSVP